MDVLLLIDIQNDYFKGGAMPLAGIDRATRNARALLDQFRQRRLPVVHVRHITTRAKATFFLPDTPGSEIHPLVSPAPDETVLIKHFPNAFRDTGLDALLRELRVDKLHVAGAMTNMCVDSTIRAGFDLGYRIVLHEDACAARGLFGTKLIHKIAVRTLGSVFTEVVDRRAYGQ